MKDESKEKLRKLLERLKEYKYVALVLLAGLVLLMLPASKSKKSGGEEPAQEQEKTETGAKDMERRLEEILSLIDGAGEVRVMLTLDSDGERVLARNSEGSAEVRDGETRESVSDSAVIVQSGSGQSGTVEVKRVYPEYRGAVVVAEGAGSAVVRGEILGAVKALTGLGGEAIQIVKMR